MGCTEGLARIFVFVANFCFLLVGLALLIVGVMYKINFNKYTDAIPENSYGVLKHVPTFSILVGVTIVFIAFLGCCGTLKSNTCMLTSYGAILFVIFLIQIGLGIFAMVTIKDTDELKRQLEIGVEELFKKYDTNNEAKEALDAIQKALQCCGTTGRSSWHDKVPDSCPTGTPPGCQDALYDAVQGSIKLIGITAMTVSVVEVVGAVLALCLSNCIRGRERQGAYF